MDARHYLVNNWAILRSANVAGHDLLLRIVLEDALDPPLLPEPVLELRLRQCHDVEAAQARLNSYLHLSICEVTQEHRSCDVLVTIADDVEDIATLQCAELLAARRPYSDVEWRELSAAILRRLQESEAEAHQLSIVQSTFSTWLHQQLDHAMRRVEATDPLPTRLPVAQARLRDMEAIHRYWQRLIDPPD